MNKVKTTHGTIVLTRRYPARAARVFAAWADAAALARWYTPGDEGWSARIEAHEFRVGGRKVVSFGPKGGPRYVEDCRYEDIVEGQRICLSMTLSSGDERMTSTLVTVEFTDERGETTLKVTDQSAYLDGKDWSEDRQKGWGETLDKLAGEVARS
jgi:uncharacterized protein YndB with AHSA1/START domain